MIVTIIRITVDTGRDIFSFFHIVELHRLAAACGRCDTAEKESDGRKQKTRPLLHRNLEGMHHVPDDDRFSPDKKHDTEQSRQQPPHICPPHCFHHCAKVFAVENTVYRQRKNHNEKTVFTIIFSYSARRFHLLRSNIMPYQAPRCVRPAICHVTSARSAPPITSAITCCFVVSVETNTASAAQKENR